MEGTMAQGALSFPLQLGTSSISRHMAAPWVADLVVDVHRSAQQVFLPAKAKGQDCVHLLASLLNHRISSSLANFRQIMHHCATLLWQLVSAEGRPVQNQFSIAELPLFDLTQESIGIMSVWRNVSGAFYGRVVAPVANAFFSVPYYVRDPIALSLVVAIISISLASSFTNTMTLPENRELNSLHTILTARGRHHIITEGPLPPCPGCVLVQVDPPLDTVLVWTNVEMGAQRLDLVVSYVISMMVVLFSTFLVHNLR